MKVGIVIVTFNSQKDIARLLESIIIQQYEDFIVYLVDNDSKDQTLNIVQKYLTRISICIIPTMINNGFAKGNNIGIRKAMGDGCDLVFILNPDMQLEEKCIEILVRRIILDEMIGIVGPVVLFGNKPDNIIQCFGVKANFRTQRKDILYTGKELTNEIPSEIYVDYVLGGAMMIRSSVIKTTGLFEEDYFMYNDELDISYRINKSGFKTICVGDAVIRHFHNFDKHNKKGYNLMYYYVMRNRFLYFKKYHLYNNLLLSLIKEIVLLPLTFKWALLRLNNLKLLKFYYSGIVDGLLGKKGNANKVLDWNNSV